MNRFLVLIAVTILLLFILETHARAEEWWGVANLTSYHIRDADKHNQKNFGLGVEFSTNVPRLSGVAGFYDNSFNRESVYFGVAWTPLPLGDFHFGLVAGGITGYEKTAVPIVLPTMAWEHKRFGANLTFAPHVKSAPGALGLQVKYLF